MSELEPISLAPAGPASAMSPALLSGGRLPLISFSRGELDEIFCLYGCKVAEGEWRDYAIDTLKDRAVFSVFRRASERPLYRIEKNPKPDRKQGAYSVIAMTGLILKRGHNLRNVLRVFERNLRLVEI